MQSKLPLLFLYSFSAPLLNDGHHTSQPRSKNNPFSGACQSFFQELPLAPLSFSLKDEREQDRPRFY
jgi:hypothetical protein